LSPKEQSINYRIFNPARHHDDHDILILIGAGIFGLLQSEDRFVPKYHSAIIAVFSNYTGVGPEDNENTLTRPLEKPLFLLRILKTLTSYSSSGVVH
jgi:HAE1 family hydrophobic/amphiphilic exporter-1